jgi:CRP/FNR family cyclic AMP-dependent transcriptional regulator
MTVPEHSALLDEISDMLVNCDMFNGFSPPEIKAVAHYFGVSKIEQGGTIFEEGGIGTFMCVVDAGNVSILKTNQEGKNVAMATLHKGRAFGEMAVLDGERRSATCIASTDCALLTLSKNSLEKMLAEAPGLAAKVIRTLAVSLSKRLRIADGKLVDHQI